MAAPVANDSAPHRQYSQQEEHEIFKAALNQAGIQVFIYHAQTQTIYFFTDHFGLPHMVLKKDWCTIEEVVSMGIIAPEHVAIFRSLFSRVAQGEQCLDARVKLCINGTEIWVCLTLTGCHGDSGRSAHAVGTLQDMTRRVDTEEQFSKETQYRLAMLADARRVYEINVTRDRFIKLESIQDTTDCGNWQAYSQAMQYLCETLVYREDWAVFKSVALRENLLRGYQEGTTEFYCEYRVVDQSGNTTWSSSATHLLNDPLSDDIKGFIYVKDIDRQKRRELELEQQAERDPLTDIYNRRTAERLISQMLDEADDTKSFGFMTIDFDDFKYVNDTFGHATGDFLLQQMAREVKTIVDECDVFARIGGDEFIVFLNGGGERLRRIAGLICETVRGICVVADSVYRPTVSIGVAVYPSCGVTFEQLYAFSDKAMYHVKQQGKNNTGFYMDQLSG